MIYKDHFLKAHGKFCELPDLSSYIQDNVPWFRIWNMLEFRSRFEIWHWLSQYIEMHGCTLKNVFLENSENAAKLSSILIGIPASPAFLRANSLSLMMSSVATPPQLKLLWLALFLLLQVISPFRPLKFSWGKTSESIFPSRGITAADQKPEKSTTMNQNLTKCSN